MEININSLSLKSMDLLKSKLGQPGERLLVEVIQKDGENIGTISVKGQELAAIFETSAKVGDKFWTKVGEDEGFYLLLRDINQDNPQEISVNSPQSSELTERGLPMKQELLGLLRNFNAGGSGTFLLENLQGLLPDELLENVKESFPKWESLSDENGAEQIIECLRKLGINYEQRLYQMVVMLDPSAIEAEKESLKNTLKYAILKKLNEQGSGPRTEQGTGQGTGTRTEQSTGSRTEQGTGPRTEQSTGPRTEQGTGPRTEQSTGPRTEQGTDTKTEQSTGSRTEQGTGPRTEQSTGPRTEQGTGPRTEQSTGPRTEQGTDTKTEQSTGSRTEQGTGSRTEQSIGPRLEQGTGPRKEEGIEPRTGQGTVQAEENHLKEPLQRLLNTITGQQLWYKTGTQNNGYMLLHLPVMYQDQCLPVQIGIESARKGSKMDEKHCRIAIQMETEGLGLIGVDAFFNEDSLTLNILSHDPENVSELVEEVLPEAKARFARLGFQLMKVGTDDLKESSELEDFLRGLRRSGVDVKQ